MKLSLDELIEIIAISIVNPIEPINKEEEPPPFRSIVEITEAKQKMEKCTFDSDEEMWEKARELAINIIYKGLPVKQVQMFCIDVIGFTEEDINNMSKEELDDYLKNRGIIYECVEFNY